MKKLLFLLLALPLVSCQKQELQKPEETKASDETKTPEETTIPNHQKPEETTIPNHQKPEETTIPNLCPKRSTPDGSNCLCGGVKLKAKDAAQWECIGETWLCYRKDGCMANGEKMVSAPGVAVRCDSDCACGEKRCGKNMDCFGGNCYCGSRIAKNPEEEACVIFPDGFYSLERKSDYAVACSERSWLSGMKVDGDVSIENICWTERGFSLYSEDDDEGLGDFLEMICKLPQGCTGPDGKTYRYEEPVEAYGYQARKENRERFWNAQLRDLAACNPLSVIPIEDLSEHPENYGCDKGKVYCKAEKCRFYGTDNEMAEEHSWENNTDYPDDPKFDFEYFVTCDEGEFWDNERCRCHEGQVCDTRNCDARESARCAEGKELCEGLPKPKNGVGYACRSLGCDTAWTCNVNWGCVCGSMTIGRNAVCDTADGEEKAFERNDKCERKRVEENFESLCAGMIAPKGNGYACLDNSCSTPKDNMPWRCMKGRECVCGKEGCGINEKCVNDSCLCDNVVSPGKGYVCTEFNAYVDDNNDASACDFYWRCEKAEGCQCGKGTCPKNAGCRDGRCLYLQEREGETEAFVSDSRYISDKGQWLCDDSEGCRCGQELCALGSQCGGGQCACDKMREDGYRCVNKDNVCDKVGGCVCGDINCPDDTICKDGECVFWGNGESGLEKADDYVSANGFARCNRDAGCDCGEEKCPKGRLCINKQCRITPLEPDGMAYRLNIAARRADNGGTRDEALHKDIDVFQGNIRYSAYARMGVDLPYDKFDEVVGFYKQVALSSVRRKGEADGSIADKIREDMAGNGLEAVENIASFIPKLADYKGYALAFGGDYLWTEECCMDRSEYRSLDFVGLQCVRDEGCDCKGKKCAKNRICTPDGCVQPYFSEDVIAFYPHLNANKFKKCEKDSCACGKKSCFKGGYCAVFEDGSDCFYGDDYRHLLLKRYPGIPLEVMSGEVLVAKTVKRCESNTCKCESKSCKFGQYVVSTDNACFCYDSGTLLPGVEAIESVRLPKEQTSAAHNFGIRLLGIPDNNDYRDKACPRSSLEHPLGNFIRDRTWVSVDGEGRCVSLIDIWFGESPYRQALSLPPYQYRYISPLGWECLEENCECGEKSCRRSEFCIAPGHCSG